MLMSSSKRVKENDTSHAQQFNSPLSPSYDILSQDGVSTDQYFRHAQQDTQTYQTNLSCQQKSVQNQFYVKTPSHLPLQNRQQLKVHQSCRNVNSIVQESFIIEQNNQLKDSTTNIDQAQSSNQSRQNMNTTCQSQEPIANMNSQRIPPELMETFKEQPWVRTNIQEWENDSQSQFCNQSNITDQVSDTVQDTQSQINQDQVSQFSQAFSYNHSEIEIGVYELVSSIRDPENENQTLSQSGIIQQSYIISNEKDQQRIEFGCPITIQVLFKPRSIFSASANLIGLAIRAKLNIVLPQEQFKLDVFVLEDSHVNKYAIDRQINDKERVSATFEKPDIWDSILKLILNQ